jgi:hypothetical protein
MTGRPAGARGTCATTGGRTRATHGADPSSQTQDDAYARPGAPRTAPVRLGRSLGTHQTTDHALAADETGPVRRDRPGSFPFRPFRRGLRCARRIGEGPLKVPARVARGNLTLSRRPACTVPAQPRPHAFSLDGLSPRHGACARAGRRRLDLRAPASTQWPAKERGHRRATSAPRTSTRSAPVPPPPSRPWRAADQAPRRPAFV